MPTAEYHTLGCKLNFAETATIAADLAARGIARALPGQEPDLVVINTCSVTAEADRKARYLIRHTRRLHPGASIVVTGCYAQLRPEALASLPGVAVVAGNDRKAALASYVGTWLETRQPRSYITPTADIDTFTPACEHGERTRWFLKVQDGCDYRCTYCTIPDARGRSRSATVAQAVAQAREVAARGGREIVLTGVNVGDFGRRNGETFLQLIQALDSVEGIARYRISSIEPNLLTPDIISFVAASRSFMPHFHIPLQAGSDTVLRLMKRRYDTALFASRIHLIRQILPDAFIGVDVIAGARGETPELFDESLRFIESLDISRLHVFPYSERPGTPALDIPGAVTPACKSRRVELLMQLSERKHRAFGRRFEGTVRPVLVEHPAMEGFTDNYLRVDASCLPPTAGGTVAPLLLGPADPVTGIIKASTPQAPRP